MPSPSQNKFHARSPYFPLAPASGARVTRLTARSSSSGEICRGCFTAIRPRVEAGVVSRSLSGVMKRFFRVLAESTAKLASSFPGFRESLGASNILTGITSPRVLRNVWLRCRARSGEERCCGFTASRSHFGERGLKFRLRGNAAMLTAPLLCF